MNKHIQLEHNILLDVDTASNMLWVEEVVCSWSSSFLHLVTQIPQFSLQLFVNLRRIKKKIFIAKQRQLL